MKLGTIDVRGRKIDVEVREDGKFFANFEGDYFEDVTKEGLRKKLDGVIKRRSAKVSIPFVVIERDRWGQDENEKLKLRVGTITGKHASNRNYLVTWEGGDKEQVYSSGLAGAVPLELKAEFEMIVRKMREAQAAYDKYVKEHGIDLTEQVDAVVEGKGQDEGEDKA